MQKSTWWWACTLVCAWTAACSGSDTAPGRNGGSVGGFAGTGGVTAAGAGGAGGTGSFGNPNAPAPGGTGGGTAGAAGNGTCTEGSFCGPTNPDSEDCGSLTLDGDVQTTTVPGNVLLVFDRSGSMDEDWNGVKRWQAAGTAIVDALNPIAMSLTIGMVGFPSPDPAIPFGIVCSVSPISTADQITFKAGPQALTELQTGGVNGAAKYLPVMNGLAIGATPTTEGVAAADAALNAAALAGTTAVVLITDGDPNCGWNQQQTVDTITRWRTDKNILTYVVGLPGVGGGGALVLDALAVAGGTAPYLTPTNATELQTKMADIVQSTVSVGFNSCSITLAPAAEVPDELHIVVTDAAMGEQDVPRDLGNGAGWTISADGAQVELLGALCDNAQAGAYSSIRFEYGCVELPPLVIMPPE